MTVTTEPGPLTRRCVTRQIAGTSARAITDGAIGTGCLSSFERRHNVAVRPWLEALRTRLQNNRGRRSSETVRRLGTHREIQNLEDRTLLASTVLLAGSELKVLSDADESIVVQEDPANSEHIEVLVDGSPSTALGVLRADAITALTVLTGDEDNSVDLTDVDAAVFMNLTTITVATGDGNDTIVGSPDIGMTVDAGDGDDTITGFAGLDTLRGGDGDDSILGGDGADSIDAGDGNDIVDGEIGDDTILGDDGADTLNGGDDNDSILAGDGEDSVSGDAGTDFLLGDLGNDTISGGTEDDTVFGGGGADVVFGNDGADSLFGNSGRDTIDGQAGDDVINVGIGSDSAIGGDGDDLVVGGLGDDTIDGLAGNDTLNGGGGDDLVFGDGDSVLAQIFGNDLILGQTGNDTLIGTLGSDTIIGGLGDDRVQSSFETEDLAVPPVPTPPVPPPTPVPAGIGELNPAVASGGGAALGTTTTLSTGMGDGNVDFGGVDAVGEFQSNTLDPIGAPTPLDPLFRTSLYLRIGTTSGNRTILNASGETLTGTTSEATSTFSSMGLNFDLVQQAVPLNDTQGGQIGGVLAQTYTITNPGAAPVDFELVRYIENHMFSFPGASNDGGGLFMSSNGIPIYFESAGPVTPGQPTIFGGITAEGGDPLTSNRFEINRFGAILFRLANGDPLMDQLVGDADGDNIIENPSSDQEIALRNVFSLGPGESAVYTTHTALGTLLPVPPNMPPQAMNDAITTFGSNTVTIDIGSNDSDPDGAPDFSTISITSQPANGTAVSLGNGLIEYTPNQGFSGTDSFQYTLMDDDGATSNQATVTITVNAGDEIGDFLDGSIGDDTIIGAGGNDTIVGSFGNDSIRGGDGDDSILGAAGNDTLEGGSGNDTLLGQGGADSLSGGDGEDLLIWRGDGDGNDTLSGGISGDRVEVRGDDTGNIFGIAQSSEGRLRVEEGPAVLIVDFDIKDVAVNLDNGDDLVTIGDVSSVVLSTLTINGDAGADTITAASSTPGSLRLVMNGGVGEDTIFGGSGNETINGGEDDDLLSGGGGSDLISGDAGADMIGGEDGNDTISGGDGNDSITGGNGDDSVSAGNDNDTVDGGAGDDTIRGQFGDDNLIGSFGNDSIDGGLGADNVIGGSGNDRLDGGRNNDVVIGNSGDDTILGNHGNDFIRGNGGADEIVAGDGDDTVFAGDGADGVDAGDGDDQVFGDNDSDTIIGGDGDDTLSGGGAQDTILGQEGDDVLNGNGGSDLAALGEGNVLNLVPLNIEIINELFVLSDEMLENLDGV